MRRLKNKPTFFNGWQLVTKDGFPIERAKGTSQRRSEGRAFAELQNRGLVRRPFRIMTAASISKHTRFRIDLLKYEQVSRPALRKIAPARKSAATQDMK
jgi:hypothetical protein